MLIVLLGTVFLVAVDIVTKVIFEGGDFALIPNVLSILSAHNDGAAFSMFSGGVLPLVIFTFVILGVGTVFYIKYKEKTTFFNVACAFFLGGTLGNFFDRIFLGYVRDFIKFDFIDFPIFNFADIFLNAAVVLFAVYFLFLYKDTKAKEKHGKDGTYGKN